LERGKTGPVADSHLDGERDDSWEQIVVAHHRYIYNLAYCLCNDRHEAEDLTQETFLRAFEGLAGFRGEAAPRTWLTRIAVNAYLATKRRRARHQSLALEVFRVADRDGEPERVVVRKEMQWCIHHVLQHHLTRQYRVVIVLKDLNGFSYEEIATMLGVSVSAVKSRLHRARRAYRDHLVKSGCAGLLEGYTCYCEGVRGA
jgi:RNA polymerase sigma-70 factor (ECF subfamily)